MLALKKSVLLSMSMLMVSGVTGLLMTSVTGSLLCSASNVSWLPKIGNALRNANAATLLNPSTTKKGVLIDLEDLRGGGLAPATEEPTQEAEAEETMRQYLQDAAEVRKFHVQGWRWHTMSVAREAERLQNMALRLEAQDEDTDLSSLQEAADYVVNFNMKALHRVENMFFPWVRERMNESPVADAGMKTALSNVMDELQSDQRKLAALGDSLVSAMKAGSKTPPKLVAQLVASQSGQLRALTQSMLERELTQLIPAIGLCVPVKEQQKFNDKVITFLGVFEARTHLVHMHEVVSAADNTLEQELWEECIPKLPRSLIPRWKRTLYEPKASMLDAP